VAGSPSQRHLFLGVTHAFGLALDQRDKTRPMFASIAFIDILFIDETGRNPSIVSSQSESGSIDKVRTSFWRSFLPDLHASQRLCIPWKEWTVLRAATMSCRMTPVRNCYWGGCSFQWEPLAEPLLDELPMNREIARSFRDLCYESLILASKFLSLIQPNFILISTMI
jgi:hypothetical protein